MTGSSLSRRQFVERAAATGAALALPGIAASQAAAKTRTARYRASGSAKSTLVILEAEIPPGLDFDGAQSSNPATQEVFHDLYAGLVGNPRVLRSGVYVPVVRTFNGALAKSWKKHGLSWTFTLPKGVRNQLGHEFTADDVVWTEARGKSVSGAVPVAWFLLNLASVLNADVFAKNATPATKRLHGEVVKLGRYSVRYRQYEPNALFPLVLSIPHAFMYDAKEVKKHATAADPWAHNWTESDGAAGYGAYYITSWQKDVQITLKANPGFRGAKPGFQTVSIHKVPQSSTRVAAILSGAADVVTGLSPREFAQLAKSKSVDVLAWHGNSFNALGLNYAVDPWGGGGNPARARLLRQAVAYALPYNQIVKKDFFGYARQWTGMVPTIFYGAKQYPGRYVTNIQKAKSLLAQAGYPGGKGLSGPGLTLVYAAENQDTLEPVATDIQTALAAIGITIQLDPIPLVQFSDRLSVKKDLPMYLRDPDIVIGADAGFMAQLDYVSAAKGSINNNYNYSNPRVDALYAASKTAQGAKRLALLGQLQDILINDLPRIPLVERPSLCAVRKGITGWAPTLDQGMEYRYFHAK